MSPDPVDRERAFRESVPGGFFVDPADPERLAGHLRQRGLMGESEELRTVGKAGEGNMNLTLRVSTSERSFVLKQARPWVEKYPQIPAPADRALVEIAFYETAGALPKVRRAMPQLLGADRGSRLLILEDLGEAQDFTPLYAGERLRGPQLDELVTYLVALHPSVEAATATQRQAFQNREMRALNHEHIFRLPLAPDNGLDLDAFTPGLAGTAEPLKNDKDYVSRVTELGVDYLADGDSLLHGDFFPGSWLRTDSGVRIIDPEFCFLGAPTFDVGFMLGHLNMAGQPASLGEHFLSMYREKASDVSDYRLALARQFAGVEIMRRLIGVAQLPLTCGLEKKEQLLDLSRELVLSR